MRIVSRFERLRPGGVDPAEDLVSRRGVVGDFAALSRFHYREGKPAMVCEVISLIDREGVPVACLVVSRPTLNAWWRRLAWPGEFDVSDKREVADRVNEKLRTIARVIVEPRYRGVGLAMRLVQEYLRAPLTPYTEAVAVMGRVCPFFERAGMVRHERASSRRDVVLLRAMRREGVRPVSSLGRVPRGLRAALRTWADASSATRGLEDAELGRAAAAALLFPVFAYTSPPSEARGDHVGHCEDRRSGRVARVVAGASGLDTGVGGFERGRGDGSV